MTGYRSVPSPYSNNWNAGRHKDNTAVTWTGMAIAIDRHFKG